MKHSRTPTKKNAPRFYARCQSCGKLCYPSKGAAVAATGRHRVSMGGPPVTPYKCQSSRTVGRVWHIGTLRSEKMKYVYEASQR